MIGGTVVLFELFLKELREKKIEFDVIDTLKDNYPNALSAYISICIQLLKKIKYHESLSLHATTNSLITIGPVIVLLSKIFHRKVSIRKFAGNFHEIFENGNFLKKKLIKYVLENSTINFFETKYLVDYFHKFNRHTYWFPNVRERIIASNMPRTYNKRFIYVGTINIEKGINEIIEVSKILNHDVTIDLYGPILDENYSEEYFKKHHVNYKGVLESHEVLSVMNTYDVLILPSYREGYPGVIIEAFSLGIPSIATKLPGIMEMIENKKNGILINLQNVKELEEAIRKINELTYKELSQKALVSFNDYESKNQTELFLKRLGAVS